MIRILIPVLLVGVVVSIAACSDSVSQLSDSTVTVPESVSQTELIAYGKPGGLRAVSLDEGSQSAQDRFAARRSSVLALIESEAPLATRDRQVREYVARHAAAEMAHYVEQFAAVHMLREILQATDTAMPESIEFYADLLVRNSSPEAALILDAIQQLQDRWTPEKRAQTARLTIESGLAWIERVCTDCGNAKSTAARPAVDDIQIVRKTRSIQTAVEELGKLASP